MRPPSPPCMHGLATNNKHMATPGLPLSWKERRERERERERERRRERERERRERERERERGEREREREKSAFHAYQPLSS